MSEEQGLSGAKALGREHLRPAVQNYVKYGLDEWLTLLGRELGRLDVDEHCDVDVLFGALEPAFVHHRWSGAYWEVDGPVAVLREVVAPEQSGAEFAIGLVGAVFGKNKVPRVFEAVHRGTVVHALRPEIGERPLFSSGAFLPVFVGERSIGVLSLSGPGFSGADLPAAYLIAHHLSAVGALTGLLGDIGPRASVGRVSSLIAGQIREPVKNLSSASGRMRERLSRDDALRPLALDLECQATRLKLLVDDLVDYTRPLTVWTDEIPLDMLARSVAVSVRRVHHEICEGRQIVLDTAKPSPIAAIDPSLVARALGNVLVNVAERTPRGGTVTVQIRRGDDDARIDVSADAAAPEDAARVFQPFGHVDRPRRGIGLAVARRLIRASGGKLTLTHRRAGLHFRMRVPLAKEAD